MYQRFTKLKLGSPFFLLVRFVCQWSNLENHNSIGLCKGQEPVPSDDSRKNCAPHQENWQHMALFEIACAIPRRASITKTMLGTATQNLN